MFKAEALRVERAELGMTQAELAKALGVTPRAIAHWELGTRTPRAAALFAISRVTGKPIHHFINGDWVA